MSAESGGTITAAARPSGMSALLYILGIVVAVTRLAWVATLLGIAQVYVAGAALLTLAAAIVLAVARSRQRA